MNDTAARGYAIRALVESAVELDGRASDVARIDVGRAEPLHDLAARMREAAERLETEREPLNPVDALRRAIWLTRSELARLVNDIGPRVVRLEEHVEAVERKVLGGPPRAGFVPLDGDELDRGGAG